MRFSKYHAQGNDFILIEDQIAADQVIRMCNRRHGIGADGLISVRKKVEVDASIDIFNADGSLAEMCGNGLCCVAQFLVDQGSQKKELAFSVYEKRYALQLEGEQIIVNMGVPTILKEGKIDQLSYICIDSGVPHFIHFCDDIHRVDFNEIARDLRYHHYFSPAGVNVNFVKVIHPHLLHMRTYERGVEGETFACGTGATAACVAAWKKYNMQGEIEVEFASKERLHIHVSATNKSLQEVMMRGYALRVYQGELAK